MFDLKDYLDRQRQQINSALEDYIRRLTQGTRMREPIRYVLMAGGKRLRPILCLAANHAAGGDSITALPAACALEMIHTYSLIHDDLPSLDDDDMRRGRPTCHVQFNEATAVLTGDALLTMAFEILSQAALDAPVEHAICYVKAIQTIARASGSRGMIEGQARDLAFEGRRLAKNQLQEMHALKTGAMIEAAVHSGALLAAGGDEEIKPLLMYAKCIGLAFQVVDDILNVTGDPQQLGKAVGTDQLRNKNTYPSLLGLEPSRDFADSLIDRALQAISDFDNKAEPLRAIAGYVIERQR